VNCVVPVQHERLSLSMTVTILSDICDALTYMHDLNLVHGLVSAHAIQMVTATFAKLGNFEFSVDRSVILTSVELLCRMLSIHLLL